MTSLQDRNNSYFLYDDFDEDSIAIDYKTYKKYNLNREKDIYNLIGILRDICKIFMKKVSGYDSILMRQFTFGTFFIKQKEDTLIMYFLSFKYYDFINNNTLDFDNGIYGYNIIKQEINNILLNHFNKISFDDINNIYIYTSSVASLFILPLLELFNSEILQKTTIIVYQPVTIFKKDFSINNNIKNIYYISFNNTFKIPNTIIFNGEKISYKKEFSDKTVSLNYISDIKYSLKYNFSLINFFYLYDNKQISLDMSGIDRIKYTNIKIPDDLSNDENIKLVREYAFSILNNKTQSSNFIDKYCYYSTYFNSNTDSCLFIAISDNETIENKILDNNTTCIYTKSDNTTFNQEDVDSTKKTYLITSENINFDELLTVVKEGQSIISHYLIYSFGNYGFSFLHKLVEIVDQSSIDILFDGNNNRILSSWHLENLNNIVMYRIENDPICKNKFNDIYLNVDEKEVNGFDFTLASNIKYNVLNYENIDIDIQYLHSILMYKIILNDKKYI